MARAKTSPEQGSLFKAIDGSHLKWNVFRQDVLQPFGIKVAKSNEQNIIPPALLSRLEEGLVDLGRFDNQRQKWQDQVAIGQGFTSPAVFPPNILPQARPSARTQRFLSPKMGRENLPRRMRSSNCLFELPSSKPIYAAGFVTEAFSEAEHLSLPSSLSAVGTTIDFTSGVVGSGRILHCPFLVFERCPSMESDDIEHALNSCAISGAQCVKGLQDISQRAHRRLSGEIYSFSCVLNDKMAIIDIHTIDEQGKYVMSALCKFDLVIDEHFNMFLAWIEAIEDWANGSLLPLLKDCLLKLSHSGDTPPASPMPSLTLSIDTEIGTTPELLHALRRTYPTVAWHGDEIVESPINSSIAHCGTPAEGRKARSLSLTTPSSSTFGNLMLRRGRGSTIVSPINTRNPQLPYAPARPSPFSPRYSAATPAPMCETIMESPCRPGTLSPYTPEPDQPWAAKSPMLVLQKRVDVAMNEVQDLRHQVELLQSELAVKNQQITESLSEIMARLPKPTEDARPQESQHMMQETQRVTRELHADGDNDSASKHDWISFALRYDGWEVLLEQLLFIVALIALAIMGLMVFRDMLPVIAQIPVQVWSDLSSLHINSRWRFDWRRISRVQDLLPGKDLRSYFGVGHTLD